jgi:hypothetical protein
VANATKYNEASRRCRSNKPDQYRKADRQRRYGLSPEAYYIILAAQGGVCAIPGCGVLSTDENPLHVDHDHTCCLGRKSCGECIRGLLCNRHNLGIGYFGDDPELLIAAAQYLQGGLP